MIFAQEHPQVAQHQRRQPEEEYARGAPLFLRIAATEEMKGDRTMNIVTDDRQHEMP